MASLCLCQENHCYLCSSKLALLSKSTGATPAIRLVSPIGLACLFLNNSNASTGAPLLSISQFNISDRKSRFLGNFSVNGSSPSSSGTCGTQTSPVRLS